MHQSEFWAEIAQAALNFIVVNALTQSAQKATVTDLKTDLRTTKEDIMAEIKQDAVKSVEIKSDTMQ